MLLPIVVVLLTLVAATLAQQPLNTTHFNTTQEFLIKIYVKANQPSSKCALFDNLYLTSYHTAAGQSDLVFTNESAVARPFFLSVTNVTGFHRIYYETGNDFPWTMKPTVTGFYDGWQPVWLQAVANEKFGGGLNPIEAAAFVNETGLQWNTAPQEDYNQWSGWLVCDWVHGVPQLFWRYDTYTWPAPSSCADVDLVLEYV